MCFLLLILYMLLPEAAGEPAASRFDRNVFVEATLHLKDLVSDLFLGGSILLIIVELPEPLGFFGRIFSTPMRTFLFE